ncbi:MAG: hypothetical protein B1H11_13195 [Desulfobacteraceae bacterium 4484_190.1]|nr:MAG: hypothetical protein B1H11_13195 [Desulfobacteraceae bacterium 4484_190.1]
MRFFIKPGRTFQNDLPGFRYWKVSLTAISPSSILCSVEYGCILSFIYEDNRTDNDFIENVNLIARDANVALLSNNVTCAVSFWIKLFDILFTSLTC